MTKQEFLKKLENGLSGLSKNEIDEQVNFYSEMIDDRMEEGLSQEEAVAAVGDVDEILRQTPYENSDTEKKASNTKRKLKTWELILLIAGSPLWLVLVLVLFAVLLVIFVVLWALVISLWAVFGALAVSCFAGIVGGIAHICTGNVTAGLALISTSLVCAGLSLLLFLGCKAATKGIVTLTKKIVLKIKNNLNKRRNCNESN